MKAKTIHAVLSKKISSWIDTLPKELQARAKRDTIVTGGCIASMLLRERVSDYDVYFRSREVTIAIAKHYVELFKANRKPSEGIPVDIRLDEGKPEAGDNRVRVIVKSAGIASEDDSESTYSYFEARPPEEAQSYVGEVMDDYSEIEDLNEEMEGQALRDSEDDYRPVFLSTNAITLSGKIQIILRFWGEPQEIHSNYDYVHCTNYWTPSGSIKLNQEALESLLTKELRYIGSKYPICSVIRARKFIQRGWTINAGQFVKMCFQISKLDLNDLRTLEDQLTGVDVAYFRQVIDLLQEKDKTRVDDTYLIEIIDRIF